MYENLDIYSFIDIVKNEALQNNQICLKNYTEILEKIKHEECSEELIKECIELCDIAMEFDEIDCTQHMLNYLLTCISKMNIDDLMIAYMRARIKFCEKIKNEEELIPLYEKYYELMNDKYKELSDIKIANINTQLQYLKGVKEQKQLLQEEQRLKKQSEHDELTELPNRYALNEYSKKYFKKAYDEQKNFGVIIVDVDHFKQYNDNYGHLDGDKRLKIIAQIIQKCCNGQFCARFGGDEFFIITFDISEEEMYKIAHSIKESAMMLGELVENETQNSVFTVSQGYVVGIPNKNHTFIDFWHAADVALFKGKRDGKNNISLGEII